MLHGKSFHVDADSSDETVVSLLKALASLPRWHILQALSEGSLTVIEVSQALDMPLSTVAAQIKILEDAGFVRTELRPASHGLQKVCFRTYDSLLLQLPYLPSLLSNSVEVEMPVGAYTNFEVTATCGLASSASVIGFLDDPISFYEPRRVEAGLVWFRSGFVEYTFPNRLQKSSALTNIVVSMEICSEAPLHNNTWPSDITLWINNVEVGTWTCPGDFGGQRGRLTPAWWDSKDSQYGVLKRWMVNPGGSFIDGYQLSRITIRDLGIESQPVITVRLGVKEDAQNVGGVNLFGSTFGNYAQDITLRIEQMRTTPSGKNRAPSLIAAGAQERR
jgi:predicted transcriptional regulator